MKNTKKQIQNEYDILIRNLEDRKEKLKNLLANNTKLQDIQNAFIQGLEENIQSSKDLMKETLDSMVWDNLVIAFFGETNAGKSTIIETMRILFDDERKRKLEQTGQGEDGKIIGDGQADFTKVYNEYILNVFGKVVTLIDVPGIEGKEEDFIDDIKKALKQAHIVFYVQGHNKKPDVETAKKIKRYLNDWVSVYSIYNVRGGASNYDEDNERENLFTSDIDKTYLLIEDTFKEILQDVYKGNIAIQALLALCSKANFALEREDLASTQCKLVNYFGNKEAIYEFSHFKEMVNLVRNKTEYFEEEILAANKQKLKAQYKKITRHIANIIEAQRQNIDKLNKGLCVYKKDVENVIKDTKKRIQDKAYSTHSNIFSRLLNDICKAIDYAPQKELQDKISNLCQQCSNDYSRKMQEIITESLRTLNSQLMEKQKKLLDIYKYKHSIYTVNHKQVPINIDSHIILDDISFGVKDILEEGGQLALAASGFIFGPLVGAISLGCYGVGKLIKGIWGKDDAKEQAKTDAKKQIDEARRLAYNKLDEMNQEVFSQIDNIKIGTLNKVNNDITNLKEMENILIEMQTIMTHNV